MKQISRLPDAELEVMQALWAVPEYPARTSDLAARLDRDWKAPTCSSSCPGWRSGALSGERRRGGPTATPLW